MTGLKHCPPTRTAVQIFNVCVAETVGAFRNRKTAVGEN